MSDLIERKDAIDYFVTNIGVVDEDGYAVDDYDERVKIWTERFSGIPSAEPERKKGRWSDYKDEHSCSVCKCVVISDCWDDEIRYDYCPYCGADMRGE